MRTFAIGDIHGCRTALQALLRVIDPQSADTLIFLGDYVDRGADSKGVIDTLLALQGQCRVVALCGNHERMMQGALHSPREMAHWMYSGGGATLQSYGVYPDELPATLPVPKAHLDFLDDLLLYYETDSHIFTHATPEPFVPVAAQNESSLLWRRYGTDSADENVHISGKVLVCGHTPQRNGRVLVLPGLLCIDTFCFGGGWLSALEVGENVVWQANEQGESRYYHLG